MSEKKRLYRLKQRVRKKLEQEGYDVFFATGDPLFHLIATRENQTKLIYVSLERPTENVIHQIIQARRQAAKEVWFREKNCLSVLCF